MECHPRSDRPVTFPIQLSPEGSNCPTPLPGPTTFRIEAHPGHRQQGLGLWAFSEFCPLVSACGFIM